MARIRTIKPEFWTDEDLSTVSYESRLMAIALLNYADDEGYFKAHSALIRAACFPFDEDSTIVRRTLTELSKIGYLSMFEGSDGKDYGYINGFSRHQKIDRKKESKIKPLRDSTINRRSIDDQSTLERKGTGNREQGKKDTNVSCRAEAPDDVNANAPPAKPTNDDAKQVLAYLNQKTGRDYQAVESNLSPIKARLSEYGTEKLYAVIDAKVSEWQHDEAMAKYLRPATLFNATKCAQYAGELNVKYLHAGECWRQNPIFLGAK